MYSVAVLWVLAAFALFILERMAFRTGAGGTFGSVRWTATEGAVPSSGVDAVDAVEGRSGKIEESSDIRPHRDVESAPAKLETKDGAVDEDRGARSLQDDGEGANFGTDPGRLDVRVPVEEADETNIAPLTEESLAQGEGAQQHAVAPGDRSDRGPQNDTLADEEDVETDVAQNAALPMRNESPPDHDETEAGGAIPQCSEKEGSQAYGRVPSADTRGRVASGLAVEGPDEVCGLGPKYGDSNATVTTTALASASLLQSIDRKQIVVDWETAADILYGILEREKLGPFSNAEEPNEHDEGLLYNTKARQLLRYSDYRKALVKSWQFSSYGPANYIVCADDIRNLIYLMIYKGANNMIRANLVEDRPVKLRMRQKEEAKSRKSHPTKPKFRGANDADKDVETECHMFKDFDWSKTLDPDMCIFTFVRHPFDHFVSAYNEAEYRWSKQRKKADLSVRRTHFATSASKSVPKNAKVAPKVQKVSDPADQLLRDLINFPSAEKAADVKSGPSSTSANPSGQFLRSVKHGVVPGGPGRTGAAKSGVGSRRVRLLQMPDAIQSNASDVMDVPELDATIMADDGEGLVPVFDDEDAQEDSVDGGADDSGHNEMEEVSPPEDPASEEDAIIDDDGIDRQGDDELWKELSPEGSAVEAEIDTDGGGMSLDEMEEMIEDVMSGGSSPANEEGESVEDDGVEENSSEADSKEKDESGGVSSKEKSEGGSSESSGQDEGGLRLGENQDGAEDDAKGGGGDDSDGDNLHGYWKSLPKSDEGLGTEERALAFLFGVLSLQWMEKPKHWLDEKDDARTKRAPMHRSYLSGPLVNKEWNYGTHSRTLLGQLVFCFFVVSVVGPCRGVGSTNVGIFSD